MMERCGWVEVVGHPHSAGQNSQKETPKIGSAINLALKSIPGGHLKGFLCKSLVDVDPIALEEKLSKVVLFGARCTDGSDLGFIQQHAPRLQTLLLGLFPDPNGTADYKPGGQVEQTWLDAFDPVSFSKWVAGLPALKKLELGHPDVLSMTRTLLEAKPAQLKEIIVHTGQNASTRTPNAQANDIMQNIKSLLPESQALQIDKEIKMYCSEESRFLSLPARCSLGTLS